MAQLVLEVVCAQMEYIDLLQITIGMWVERVNFDTLRANKYSGCQAERIVSTPRVRSTRVSLVFVSSSLSFI